MTDAKKIAELHRRVRNLELMEQQPFRAIRGVMPILDGDNNVVGLLGSQFDGTSAYTTLTGPIPPRPTTPSVAVSGRALLVVWDGGFEPDVSGGYEATQYAPMDFARVNIQVAVDAGFTTDVQWRETYESPRAGTRGVPIGAATWWVRLCTTTVAGKDSPWSGVSGPHVVA